MKSEEVISVLEVAKRLGRRKETIEQALRNKTFPIGVACKSDSGRYLYIIPRKPFERFISGVGEED